MTIDRLIQPKCKFVKDSEGNKVNYKDQIVWAIFMREKIDNLLKENSYKMSYEQGLKTIEELNKSTFYISNDDMLASAEYQGFRCAFLGHRPHVVANTCNLYLEKSAASLKAEIPTRSLFNDFFNGYQICLGKRLTKKMIASAVDTGMINPENIIYLKNEIGRCTF